MIRLIDYVSFASFYPRMKEEFPASELKSIEDFIDLLKEGKYACYGYYDGETLKGYALGYLTSNKIFWLDYLHIFKENQSGGYGSKFLNELLKDYASKGILLETEEPSTEDYHDNQNRRMRFYDKFNITHIKCHYLFPCSDGTYIESLNLEFIPSKDVIVLSKDEARLAVRESVSVIHKSLPHSKSVMEKYINEIGDTPIYHFSLEDVDVNSSEEMEAVGRLIYYTDPYVYPALFDSNIDYSIKCARSLLVRDTLFSEKNIKVGKINGKIAGFMVILEKFPKNNYSEMKVSLEESLGFLTPKFEHVMEGYFNTLDYAWEGLQIMSLAVLPEFRKMRVGTKMLNSLSSKNVYSLACVKDNQKARDLYRKCGFEFKFEYPGYTDIMCVELVRK